MIITGIIVQDPVIFSNATGDSGSGPNASTDVLVLSDLLDIEIKWPEFSTNVQNVTTIRELETSAPSLNLIGVDLDNFFANVVTEVPQSAVEEHSVANKQAVSTESHVFSDQDNLSMFQSFQSSDVAVKSGDVTGSKSGDSTLWEAEFQSASSGTVPVGIKSADLFLGSSPDLLRPIDTDVTATSNSGTDAKFEISNQDDGEYKNKQNLTSPINDDWGQNHIWGTSNAKIPSKTDQFEINSKTTDSNLKNDLNNVSSVSDYCMQDDLLMTSSTSITAKSEKAKGDEDSFGSWQHFTSSGNIVEKGSMGGNTDVDGMEFGGFAQPDLFAGSSSIQKGVADVNTIQSENFPLGSAKPGGNPRPQYYVWSITMEEGAMKGRGAITQTGSTGNSSSANTVAISVDSNLEMLMSQMPDLSFMLDNKLSIPSKPKARGWMDSTVDIEPKLFMSV
ncbi:hypothetical protein ACLOJK_037881 [Asimina triloba]